MWEDHRKGKVLLKILLVLFILVFAVVLAVGYKFVSGKTREQETELQAATVQSQENLSAAKEEQVERVEADYRQDMDTVEEYLPGIVCWGENITAGSEGGVSFAIALQDLIDENLCDQYDFRETLDYADNISRVDWDDFELEIPVVNMGSGTEDTNTVIGRSGAMPFVLAKSISIPAECEPVQVELQLENGKKVTPLTQNDLGINNVTIEGIEGQLFVNTQRKNNPQYFFTRLAPGEEIEIAAGTGVITSGTGMYTDYFHIIFIGNYGGFDSPKELIEQQKTLLSRITGNKDRYIVIGPYLYKGSYGNSRRLDEYDAAMAAEFGGRFINIRKYLSTDAMAELKLNPNQKDKKCMKEGIVPPSLRASMNSPELTSSVYRQMGQVIYNRMEQLGYFEEIIKELEIEKPVEEGAQNAGKK